MATAGHDDSLCPIYHHAIELIGRRWTGAILQVMRGGVVRFSDLAAAIPGLSDRMLSERLKELEAERLVERSVIPETPVRVEYRLTAGGEALGSVLDAVMAWAHDWLRIPDPAPVHSDIAEDCPGQPRRARRRRVGGPA
jgi:DNA-binding HxlR family transcriptional regulator